MKHTEGMMDNRMVKDMHQEGIKRVMQRGHDKMDSAGHNGKMGMHHGKESNFSRRGEGMTPTKA